MAGDPQLRGSDRGRFLEESPYGQRRLLPFRATDRERALVLKMAHRGVQVSASAKRNAAYYRRRGDESNARAVEARGTKPLGDALGAPRDAVMHALWSAFCNQWVGVAAAMVGLFDAPLTSR